MVYLLLIFSSIILGAALYHSIQDRQFTALLSEHQVNSRLLKLTVDGLRTRVLENERNMDSWKVIAHQFEQDVFQLKLQVYNLSGGKKKRKGKKL